MQTIQTIDFSWLDNLLDNGFGQFEMPPNLQPLSPASSASSTDSIHPVRPYFYDTEGPTMTSIAREEMEFCVARFRKWPSLWLSEGKAPFIHPRLYKTLPKPLEEAYSACAIYATKKDVNSNIALAIIENKANALLHTPVNAGSNPLEHLAAVQALVIFQIIRLFDGDIRQRAQAEEIEPVMARWTDELCAKSTDGMMNLSAATAGSWREWLFAESLRRTLIMSLMVRGIYALVKKGYCDLGPEVTKLSFTAQADLWAADSLAEWTRARQKRDTLWIDQMKFDRLLEKSKVRDVDELGFVMMVVYNGKDEVELWSGRTS